MRLLITLGIGLLCAVSSGAAAQPGPIPAPVPDAKAPAQDGRMRIEVEDADVADVVEDIVKRGGLQVLVDDSAAGHKVTLNLESDPVSLLRRVAQASGLEVKRNGKVFIVREPLADAPEPAEGDKLSLQFKDVPVGDLIEVLAVETGVPIEIEKRLSSGTFRYLNFKDQPLKPILQSIARTLEAELAWERGRYILRAAAKPE